MDQERKIAGKYVKKYWEKWEKEARKKKIE